MRYSLETKLSAEAIKKEAITNFVDKLGMSVISDQAGTLCLEGGGGHITMVFCPNGVTTLEIQTQEWDDAVKDFLAKIRK